MIPGVGNVLYIYYVESKALSDEIINYIKTSDYETTSYLSYYNIYKKEGFDGGCLKQDQGIIPFNGIVNILNVYEITNTFNISDYPTLENCLFGVVKITENVHIDKYGYSDYGIAFHRHGSFSFHGTGLGRNVKIFRVDMSSSTKIDNRKKDILFLEKGSTQGL